MSWLRGSAVLPLVVLLVSCQAAAAPAEDGAGYFSLNVMDIASANALPYTSQNVDARDVRDFSAPDVTLPKLGAMSGSTTTSNRKQRTIYQYLGVPFAKAPVGELRFKEPAALDPWNTTLDASKPGKVCIQMAPSAAMHALRAARMHMELTAAEDESEDCLLLNVFSPKVDSAAKLPVLVFMHGGSFASGSARDLPPNNLLDYDMVLVTPQYRLGPLGFLNLQEEDVPGNAGLLDVLAALQWVQDNIQSFGGDPQKVTLGGHSAGAVLASLAYLSPLSKGLVRSVMPMSGSSLTFWAWDRRPEVSAIAIANLLKCDSSDSAARVSCLRSATPAAMKQAFISYGAASLYAGVGIGMSGGGPSIQRAGKIVLPDLPENILRGKAFSAVPLLTGITKHEGTFGMALLQKGYIEPHKFDNNATFFEYDLIHLVLRLLNVDDPAGFVADSAMGYFFDPSTLGSPSSMFDGLIDLYGAYGFKSPCRTHALYHAEAEQPTYLYSFAQYGPGTNTEMGITHGAEQIYLFPRMTLPMNANDLTMENTLLEFVTNFVIHQTPTPSSAGAQSLPDWEPFLEGDEHYMELAVPSQLRQNFSQELTVARRDHFWQPTAPPSNDKTTPSPVPVVGTSTTPSPHSGAQSVTSASLITALLALLVTLTRR